jgi:chromosome partitioning protein
MSVVIAVVQQKGGAGKTPTAVHLSYALSYSGKNTLLIDLDAQATASLHLLGPMYKEAQPTIYNALVTLKAIPPTPIKDHLYLLSAHDELEKAEIELPRPGSFYQVQLAKLLKQYQQYDYVVIDTPGSRVSIFAAEICSISRQLEPHYASRACWHIILHRPFSSCDCCSVQQ